LINPISAFYAGVIVLLGRQVTGTFYYLMADWRQFGTLLLSSSNFNSLCSICYIGGFFHIGEYWTLWILGKFAYDHITKVGLAAVWPF